jgi:phage head maturation protease
MRLYGTIEKADAETRMVYGYASTEAVDASGETILKSAIEGALEDYLKFANIREMHQLSAVGTAEEATVDDKGLYLAAHIVDDAAWAKVTSGVYKGFSIGGKVLARDPLNKKTITKVALYEISIVDRPQNPEARFDVWKAAGTQEPEMAKAKGKEAASTETIAPVVEKTVTPPPAVDPEITDPVAKGMAEKDAADALVKVAKARAALVESGLEKAVVDALSAEDAVAKAEALVKSAPAPEAAPAAEPVADPIAKATAAVEALTAALAAATPAEPETVEKGMYSVSRFADLIGSIAYLASDAESEAEMEGDGSPVPQKLRDWLKAGAAIFKDMAKEEIDELVAAASKTKKATEVADLVKAAAEAASAKVSAEATDALSKVTSERDGLAKALDSITERIDPLVKTVEALGKRLAEIEEQPLPPKTAGPGAVVKAVSKEADSTGAGSVASREGAPSNDEIVKALAAMSEDDRAMALIKAAHQLPHQVAYH